MLKVYDYICEECGLEGNDILVEEDEIVKCSACEKPMTRLFPCPKGGEHRGKFSPFWSDTFEMRVNDREDLKKLQDLRKEHGLECVGHRRQSEDRAAVRHNYETD